jgi:hypothetical protein
MSSGGNPFGAFLGFWMFLQLVSALTTLAGGLYALFCLHRMAQNMARLADSMEDWTQRQNTLPNSLSDYSSGNPAAQPFVPPVPQCHLRMQRQLRLSYRLPPQSCQTFPQKLHTGLNRRNRVLNWSRPSQEGLMSEANEAAARHVIIVPSMISADWSRAGQQMEELAQAGCEWLHFDAMDGPFCAQSTLGPMFLKALRAHSDLHFDAHLMMSNAGDYVEEFVRAGANSVSVHVEANVHLHRVLTKIKDSGAQAGVVLNPATPVNTLDAILPTSIMFW